MTDYVMKITLKGPVTKTRVSHFLIISSFKKPKMMCNDHNFETKLQQFMISYRDDMNITNKQLVEMIITMKQNIYDKVPTEDPLFSQWVRDYPDGTPSPYDDVTPTQIIPETPIQRRRSRQMTTQINITLGSKHNPIKID